MALIFLPILKFKHLQMRTLSKLSILIITLGLLVLGCTRDNSQYAGVKHFYVEFEDHIDSPFSTELIANIERQMESGDFYISEESAEQGWPFYATVPRGQKVERQLIIPPHTLVNRISPVEDLEDPDKGDHILKLWVQLDLDSTNNLLVAKQSFERVNGEWQVFSKKLITSFEIPDSSGEDLEDKVAKTLIRYTFK